MVRPRKLPKIDLNLEGIATDAVHLTRYSNAAVINPNVDKNVDTVSIDKLKLKVIDTVIISINIKRKLNCLSLNRSKKLLLKLIS